jgi:hypothetical protein
LIANAKEAAHGQPLVFQFSRGQHNCLALAFTSRRRIFRSVASRNIASIDVRNIVQIAPPPT